MMGRTRTPLSARSPWQCRDFSHSRCVHSGEDRKAKYVRCRCRGLPGDWGLAQRMYVVLPTLKETFF